jgi:hypothetical protein
MSAALVIIRDFVAANQLKRVEALSKALDRIAEDCGVDPYQEAQGLLDDVLPHATADGWALIADEAGVEGEPSDDEKRLVVGVLQERARLAALVSPSNVISLWGSAS